MAETNKKICPVCDKEVKDGQMMRVFECTWEGKKIRFAGHDECVMEVSLDQQGYITISEKIMKQYPECVKEKNNEKTA